MVAASVLCLGGAAYYLGFVAEPEVAVARAPQVLDADAIRPVSAASLVERAESGDPDALSELKQREETSLSPEEVVALSMGKEARAQQEAKKAVTEIAKKRDLSARDEAVFFKHAGDQRTFRQALVAMSQNETQAGPDLIYQAMRRFRHQQDIAEFARSLLLTQPVYKYASPALTVVIDAESLSECKDVRQLVDRARDDGDARAVRHMAKFAETTGCGVHGNEDCYPCLRQDRALVDALRAAQDRPAPR